MKNRQGITAEEHNNQSTTAKDEQKCPSAESLRIRNHDLECENAALRHELASVRAMLCDATTRAQRAVHASDALHTLGNVLNSVVVSTYVLDKRLANSRLKQLGKLAKLLHTHRGDLAGFVRDDPRGKRIPQVLQLLSDHLTEEWKEYCSLVRDMQPPLEQVTSIIAGHRSLTRSRPPPTHESLPELVDTALDMMRQTEGQEIAVERLYGQMTNVAVERDKLLQVLVTLLSIARQSLRDAARGDEPIIIRIFRVDEQQVAVSASGNGVGIAPEHLSNNASVAFATVPSQSELGAATCTEVATALGATLTAAIDEEGRGATYMLTLPSIAAKEA